MDARPIRWHAGCKAVLPSTHTGDINENIKAWTLLGTLALFGAETASIAAADAELRVRCERRANKRSRISVDGNNVARGTYQITVKSGANTAPLTAAVAVADEFEADFDSNRGDIAEGATAIPAKFIQKRSVNVEVTGPENFEAKNYACKIR